MTMDATKSAACELAAMLVANWDIRYDFGWITSNEARALIDKSLDAATKRGYDEAWRIAKGGTHVKG